MPEAGRGVLAGGSTKCWRRSASWRIRWLWIVRRKKKKSRFNFRKIYYIMRNNWCPMQFVSYFNDIKLYNNWEYIMKSFNFFIKNLLLAGIVLTNCLAQDFAFPHHEDVKALKSGQFKYNTIMFNRNVYEYLQHQFCSQKKHFRI